MKRDNIPLLLLVIASILIIVMPYILTQFSSGIDLTSNSSSNIGGAIGGTTAPIIGLVTIFLVYYTYQLQLRSSKDSDKRRNFDILYRLLNETINRINSLEYTNIGISGTSTSEDGSFTLVETAIETTVGKRALNFYRLDISVQTGHYRLPIQDSLKDVLGKHYTSELIESLSSLNLICVKMHEYDLLLNEKDILKTKISLFYDRNLKIQLSDIYSSLKDLDKIKIAGIEMEFPTRQLAELKKSISNLQKAMG